MRVGVVLPIAEEDWTDGVPPYALVRQLAVDAEAAGLDSVWVFDHLLFRFDGATTGIHECWTVLAAIAEATQRVELGTLVMCTGFRNAALLAKMAATLDHVSDGRLILGVGSGWHDPEYDAFGYEPDHKVSRFEEALEVIVAPDPRRAGPISTAPTSRPATACSCRRRGPTCRSSSPRSALACWS